MSDRPTRRAFLFAGLGLGLEGGRAHVGTVGPVMPDAPPPTRAPSAPEPVPSRTPKALPPEPAPTREQIIDRFSGRPPRYWGLEAPKVIKNLPRTSTAIALTLDYCGGSGGDNIDYSIIDMLRRFDVSATLFVNSRWITANPDAARDLAKDRRFEIANHGTKHLPLSVTGKHAYGIRGTATPGEVYDEIMASNALISDLTGGIQPRFFRPGTAHLDDVAADICLALGLIPTGFSINADAGATYPARVVTAETMRAVAGNIIIAHGNHPSAGTASGLTEAISLLKGQGATFLTLSNAVLERPHQVSRRSDLLT